MKPQKQLFRHFPDQGIYGDCHRTAIAIVLDMDAKDVPHFMDAEVYGETGAMDRFEAWLNARGIVSISIPFRGSDDWKQLLQLIAAVNVAVKPVFILGGTSRTGCNHSVVCCEGEIVCDPSLEDSGIIGPCDDGHYWLTFFGTLQASDGEAKRQRDASSLRDRLDRAAVALDARLLDCDVKRGNFYITIGNGELLAYAKPDVIAFLKTLGGLPGQSQGYPVEWHELPADVSTVPAEEIA